MRLGLTEKRFFKPLLALLLAALVIAPAVSAIRLASSNTALQKRVKTLQADVSASSKELAKLKQGTDPSAVTTGTGGNVSYQTHYPDFVGHFKAFVTPPAKTVYLTFDDGPSNNTIPILNILSQYHINATFFTVYKGDAKFKPIMQEIVKRGNAVGIHSYTHEYKVIYASMDSLLADMSKEQTLIYQATGVKPDIMRLPGGSINNYNMGIYQNINAELLRRRLVYYDWNVSSMDTDLKASAQQIANNVINGVAHEKIPIVLMHDANTKPGTVQALPIIIQTLTAQGYHFAVLNDTVHPATFGYKYTPGDTEN